MTDNGTPVAERTPRKSASKGPSNDSHLSTPSWVFGSILLVFVLCVFVFAPNELPEFKQRILAFSCATMAGLFGYFMTGDVGLRFASITSRFGKVTLRATGGLALFVLVLWWWFSSAAPIKSSKEIVNEINKNTDQRASDIKVVVQEESKKTQDTVQDSALATLETMFPLAVRIPREIDGTIIKINGTELERIISFDKNMMPMKLYWGDLFSYFIFKEGGSIAASAGTVYLQLGSAADSTRLPIFLQPNTESQLRVPGHGPEPMDAFIYNPSHVGGFSLKVTVYSADRERGRMEFREALLKTDLGGVARKHYLAVNQDGTRLRSTPENSTNVLRWMAKDTYVKILDVQNDWTRVRLPEGREGWVASKNLSPIS